MCIVTDKHTNMLLVTVALLKFAVATIVYVCVCLYSGVLLCYVVVACCSVVELGAVEGYVVCVGKHAVMRCGVNEYVLKVAC